MERRRYYSEPLLKRSYRCGDAGLIDAIEVQDKAALERVVERFTSLLRTPQACEEAFGSEVLDGRARGVATTTTYNPHAEDEVVTPVYKVGDLLFGCDAVPPSPDSWPAMRALLLRLCTQLTELLAGKSREATGGVAVRAEDGELYQFPLRLQKLVVPLLYDWSVHLPLLWHDTDLWTDVVWCFCRCARLPFTYGKERPPFSLPWRPLAGLLTGLVTELTSRTIEEMAQMPFFMKVAEHEKRHLTLLARRARFFFDENALAEMWDFFAPFFSPSGELSSVYLILFAELLPRLRLTDQTTQEALPLVQRIVTFLYKDSFKWQRGDAGWSYGRMATVQSLFAENVGLLDMGPFAEPFATDVLHTLQLRIDDIAYNLPPVAFMEAFPMLSLLSLFRSANNKNNAWLQMASTLVWMLPADTTSPLWGQLRRLIHATGVFVHPGPQTSGEMERVHCVYAGIISAAVRKMKRQHTFLTFDDTAAVDEEEEGEEEESDAMTGKGERGYVRPLPEAYLWTRSTVQHFVQLFTPDLLPALSFRWNPTANVLATVCSLVALDPETMFTALTAYLDIEHQMQLQTQQEMLVLILRQTAHHFLSCAATREPYLQLIGPLVTHMPYWVSPSAVYVSEKVLGFAAMLSLYGVLEKDVLQGDETTIQAFYQTLFHQVLTLLADSHQTLRFSVTGAALLLQHMSEPYFARVATKVWDEAAVCTRQNTQLIMVRLVAQRDPALALKKANAFAVPLLCTGSPNDEEVSFASLLLAETLYGVGREAARQQAELVRRCLRPLLGNITSLSRVMAAGHICNGFVAALLQEPCTTSCVPSPDPDPSQCLETVFYDTHLLDALHLCKATQVQFQWSRPTPSDVDLIAQLFNELMDEALFALEHVAEVAGPPSATDAGLRGLQGLPPTGSECSGSGATPTLPFLPSRQAKPFTPYNVLLGLLRWIEYLFTIHLPLYPRGEAPEEAETVSLHFRKKGEGGVTEARYRLAAEPWWESERRASYWVHFTEAHPPKYSRAYVAAFVLHHAARRVTADQRDLQLLCGADAAELFHFRWLKEGRPPFPHSQPERADTEGIMRLLELLRVLHQTPRSPSWQQPIFLRLDTCGLIEDQYALSVESTLYMPVAYWKAQSEVIRLHHSQVPKRTPQQVVKDTMDFSHLLVFTNLRSPLELGPWEKRVLLLCPVAQDVFVQRHLEVLAGLAVRWIAKNKGKLAAEQFQQALYGDGAAPSGQEGTPSSSHFLKNGTDAECREVSHDNENEEDDETRDNMKKERKMVHALFRHALQTVENIIKNYDRTCIPLKHYIFLLKLKCVLPDEVFGKGDGRDFKCVPLTPTDSLQVLEELLPVAYRLAAQYPVRGLSLVTALLSVYTPCVGKPLSPPTLRMLFALCELHSFPRLHSASCLLLCSVLQALRPRPPRRYVAMRRRGLLAPATAHEEQESDETRYAPFRTRWAALKQQYPSFHLPDGYSQVFPARYITVDKDIPQDLFQDTFPVEVEAADRVQTRRIIGDDGTLTPEIVLQYRQQMTQMVLGELAGATTPTTTISLEQVQQTWLGRVVEHQKSLFNERNPSVMLLGTVSFFMPTRVFASCLLVLLQHYRKAVEPLKMSTAQTATEECLALYQTITTLTVAALQTTSAEEKKSPQDVADAVALRSTIIQSFCDSVVLFCQSIFPQSALYTKRQLKVIARHILTEEVVAVLDFLFGLLTPAAAAEETAALVATASSADNWLNALSQVKVLTMINTFLSVLDHESMCVVLPHVTRAVRARPFLLGLAAEQVRVKVCEVLQRVVKCGLLNSRWITSCGEAKLLCREFVLFLEAQFPAEVLVEHRGHAHPVAGEDAGTTLCDSPNEAAPSDSENVAALKQTLPLIKTIVQGCCGYCTDDGDDSEHTRTLLRFICLTLDTSLPEADNVFTAVGNVLLRVIGQRMPKSDANDMILHLCTLLKGNDESLHYGRSRRARVMLTRSLRLALYLNLHRIGKYATMSTVVEAALASMAHIDGQLREEGALVCAVLSKVASVEQVQALIRGLQQEMRETHAVVAAAAAAASEEDKRTKRGDDAAEVLAAKRRFTAATWALCAFASADPYKLPPYLPQLLQFLAPLAASCSVLEARSKIKKTFERWWATHRDGWEKHYKPYFTSQQQEQILFLVKENSHYA